MIVLEAQSGEYFGNVYSMDSLQFIKSFITNGRGPGDQLSPKSLQYVKEGRMLYVFDFLKQNIYYYPVDSIVKPGQVARPAGILGDKNNRLVLNINHSHYINPVLIPATRSLAGIRANLKSEPIALLNFYDQKMKFKYSEGNYPVSKDAYPFYAYEDIYLGSLKPSEEGDKLVYNYYNTDIISIYDTAGNLLAEKQGPDKYDPSVTFKKYSNGTMIVPDKKEQYCYISPARMAEGNLFLLYNGSPKNRHDESSGELFQFTDKLAPVNRYQLSERVFDFDVDWKARKIYGLTRKNRPRIIVFNF